MIWHNAEPADVLYELNVDADKGLPNGIADLRREEYGENVLGGARRKHFAKCIATQFKSTYIIALAVTAIIYFFICTFSELGNWWEPIIILLVLVITALMAAVNEFRATNALAVLSDMASPTSNVLRDGIVKNIPSSNIVPGDIVILKTGDYIPADARIISSTELRCDESALTDETVPVEKEADLLFEDITPVTARANMVFCGCHIVHGSAKVVVTQTGSQTEMGKKTVINNQENHIVSPILTRLYGMGKIFSIVCSVVCAIYFILSILLTLSSTDIPFTYRIFENLLVTLSLAVAAVPEVLAAIGISVLALGINNMLSENVITKRIECLEKLSGISVICTDKTGILTENVMTAAKLYCGDKTIDLQTDIPNERAELLLKLALMCTNPYEVEHNQSEFAIINAGTKYLNLSKTDCDNAFPRLNGIPFDSERKLMTSINMIDGKPIVVVKGAPEILLNKCIGNLDEYLKINDQFATESLHVLCIAIKALNEIPANLDADDIESELNVVGLIALSDPLQDDIVESINTCNKAGIRTVLLTGDNINTAKTVARRIGILKDGDLAVTGAELEALSDEYLLENLEKYAVFARASATDKQRIVKLWQEKNKTVAVTGTQVSDAAALQNADIGCAMGKHSTDVAKGAGDIIVINNRFSSISNAIMSCRGLFDNIRKCVHYLFACNIGELICILFGVLIFKNSPISAIGLLLINLLTDYGPATTLGKQPTDKSIAKQRPQKRYSNILSSRITILSLMQSVFLAIVTLITYALGLKHGITTAETMAFTTLILSQFAIALNLSSDRSVIFGKFLKNRNLMLALGVGVIITILITLTPLAAIFSMTALTASQFLISLIFVLITFIVGEIYKIVRHRLEKRESK